MGKPHSILALGVLLGVLAGCANQTPVETTAPVTEPVVKAMESVNVPTAEAMEPTETAVIVNTFFRLPEGFAMVSDSDGIRTYQSSNAWDESSIVVQALPREDVLSYTQGDFLESISAGSGRVTINTMERCLLNDRDALFVDYATKQGSQNARCYCYLVPADQTYRFTFTDCTPDGAWEQAFAAAGKSIQLLEEGQFARVDRTGLYWYDLGCGMQLYAMPDMKAGAVEGYHAALIGGDVVVLLFSEAKSQVGEGFCLEEYAHAVTSANGLEDCTLDAYGNLGTVFTREDSQGVSYFYYMTVKESRDAFWICQITCPEEQASRKAEDFHRWSATLDSIG